MLVSVGLPCSTFPVSLTLTYDEGHVPSTGVSARHISTSVFRFSNVMSKLGQFPIVQLSIVPPRRITAALQPRQVPSMIAPWNPRVPSCRGIYGPHPQTPVTERSIEPRGTPCPPYYVPRISGCIVTLAPSTVTPSLPFPNLKRSGRPHFDWGGTLSLPHPCPCGWMMPSTALIITEKVKPRTSSVPNGCWRC